MRENLLKLAERCEQATGPDRELDALIAGREGALVADTRDCDGNSVTCVWPGGKFRSGEWFILPAYTASLDAAMMLVPEDHNLNVWTHRTKESTAGASVTHNEDGKGPTVFKCATPVLALCAAALRARAAAIPEAEALTGDQPAVEPA
jgi:hypothetical protein